MLVANNRAVKIRLLMIFRKFECKMIACLMVCCLLLLCCSTATPTPAHTCTVGRVKQLWRRHEHRWVSLGGDASEEGKRWEGLRHLIDAAAAPPPPGGEGEGNVPASREVLEKILLLPGRTF